MKRVCTGLFVSVVGTVRAGLRSLPSLCFLGRDPPGGCGFQPPILLPYRLPAFPAPIKGTAQSAAMPFLLCRRHCGVQPELLQSKRKGCDKWLLIFIWPAATASYYDDRPGTYRSSGFSLLQLKISGIERASLSKVDLLPLRLSSGRHHSAIPAKKRCLHWLWPALGIFIFVHFISSFYFIFKQMFIWDQTPDLPVSAFCLLHAQEMAFLHRHHNFEIYIWLKILPDTSTGTYNTSKRTFETCLQWRVALATALPFHHHSHSHLVP